MQKSEEKDNLEVLTIKRTVSLCALSQNWHIIRLHSSITFRGTARLSFPSQILNQKKDFYTILYKIYIY
jgi:hypothetical protein